MPRRSTLRLRRLALAAAVAAGSAPAWGIDYVWLGGSGSWTDPSRWSPSGTPGVGDGATLGSGTATLDIDRTIDSLTMTGGNRAGTGTLTTGGLSFSSGSLTGAGATIATGTASFNGSTNQTVNSNHVLQLNGGATWSAGNGTISAQTGGSLRVAAGTTFTDAGAASAGGTRLLGFGGGGFLNAGTYERNGLGTTNALAFTNTGTTNVNAGTLAVNSAFANTGLVHVKAGAVLAGTSSSFANAGMLAGDGTVRTAGSQWALENSGVIAPGAPDSTGALTVEGDLRLLGAGTLQVHLSSLASFDLLSVTDDITIGGTLNVVNLGYAPVVGDQFVIVTFAQRLQNSVFADLTWTGFGSGVQFELIYNPNDVTLGVLAVPEPATWALWLAGVAGIAAMRRRRTQDEA
ncbi:MAG: PEP-CTERM sorting domain-containing protein [Rubrivivax sp.]|nr:PEP-CTERM sorting domain-containing protein [Rubrivivax sp.]